MALPNEGRRKVGQAWATFAISWCTFRLFLLALPDFASLFRTAALFCSSFHPQIIVRDGKEDMSRGQRRTSRSSKFQRRGKKVSPKVCNRYSNFAIHFSSVIKRRFSMQYPPRSHKQSGVLRFADGVSCDTARLYESLSEHHGQCKPHQCTAKHFVWKDQDTIWSMGVVIINLSKGQQTSHAISGITSWVSNVMPICMSLIHVSLFSPETQQSHFNESRSLGIVTF